MRLSQYTDAYLHENRVRGKDRGLTLKTYLSYVLRGRARSWAYHYYKSLERSLQYLETLGELVPTPGIGWSLRPAPGGAAR
jgi:hypothetical protein